MLKVKLRYPQTRLFKKIKIKEDRLKGLENKTWVYLDLKDIIYIIKEKDYYSVMHVCKVNQKFYDTELVKKGKFNTFLSKGKKFYVNPKKCILSRD